MSDELAPSLSGNGSGSAGRRVRTKSSCSIKLNRELMVKLSAALIANRNKQLNAESGLQNYCVAIGLTTVDCSTTTTSNEVDSAEAGGKISNLAPSCKIKAPDGPLDDANRAPLERLFPDASYNDRSSLSSAQVVCLQSRKSCDCCKRQIQRVDLLSLARAQPTTTGRKTCKSWPMKFEHQRGPMQNIREAKFAEAERFRQVETQRQLPEDKSSRLQVQWRNDENIGSGGGSQIGANVFQKPSALKSGVNNAQIKHSNGATCSEKAAISDRKSLEASLPVQQTLPLSLNDNNGNQGNCQNNNNGNTIESNEICGQQTWRPVCWTRCAVVGSCDGQLRPSGANSTPTFEGSSFEAINWIQQVQTSNNIENDEPCCFGQFESSGGNLDAIGARSAAHLNLEANKFKSQLGCNRQASSDSRRRFKNSETTARSRLEARHNSFIRKSPPVVATDEEASKIKRLKVEKLSSWKKTESKGSSTDQAATTTATTTSADPKRLELAGSKFSRFEKEVSSCFTAEIGTEVAFCARAGSKQAGRLQCAHEAEAQCYRLEANAALNHVLCSISCRLRPEALMRPKKAFRGELACARAGSDESESCLKRANLASIGERLQVHADRNGKQVEKSSRFSEMRADRKKQRGNTSRKKLKIGAQICTLSTSCNEEAAVIDKNYFSAFAESSIEKDDGDKVEACRIISGILKNSSRANDSNNAKCNSKSGQLDSQNCDNRLKFSKFQACKQKQDDHTRRFDSRRRSSSPIALALLFPVLMLALASQTLSSTSATRRLLRRSSDHLEPQAMRQQAGSGSGAGDELSKAIMATMSTQATPKLDSSSTAQRNRSNPELDLQEEARIQQQQPQVDLLEPFLMFGRIFVICAIIVGDICGNSLVILSVCRHSKLRITTNWFVVSLACADILVALFAMTFNASVIVSGRWLFKPWVCDFWNSCDVLASTASILHLCCISIDRYIAIMRPLEYPMKINTRRVMYALCCVWISSALLSFIPIFTGIYSTAEHIQWRQDNPEQCEFVVNRVYAIVSSSISFWIPCCIMVFTYYRIYREATRQEKFIYKAQNIMPAPNHHHHHHNNGNHKSSGGGAKSKQRRSKSVFASSTSANQQQQESRNKSSGGGLAARLAETKLGTGSAPVSGDPKQQAVAVPDEHERNVGAVSGQELARLAPAQNQATNKQVDPTDDECDSDSGQSTPTKRSISKMKREHKAAKTLGIIMGVFILCWLPFFSWYTPMHICGHACDGLVPHQAVTILFWIGYFNSTLNPIIYAYFNHEFRDAFKKTLQWIFCCCNDLKCLRVNRPNDSQHYNCTYRSTQEIGLVANTSN